MYAVALKMDPPHLAICFPDEDPQGANKLGCVSGVQIGMDPGVAITILDQALNLQVTYGAVMLSFLGTSHSISL